MPRNETRKTDALELVDDGSGNVLFGGGPCVEVKVR